MPAEALRLSELNNKNQQELFLSILHHSSRGGYMIRMLLGEEDGKQPYIRHFAQKDYRKIGYNASTYNAYVTINTFKSYRRVADDVYNFSCIFIDLDGHDYKSIFEMDAAIKKTRERLQKAYDSGEITAPTMITHTGRGLGVFYVLSSSIANVPKAQKSIRYLEQVRAALTARYRQLLSDDGMLEVDSTVKDAARVCRLPGTLNKKINRYCRLDYISYNMDGSVAYCDLQKLAKENGLFDQINEVKRQIASQRIVSLEAYKMPFLTLRLQKLDRLQELRGFSCTGAREYMVFAYYNAAKQIYGSLEGQRLTEAFNKRFLEPLGAEEMEHAFSSTEKNVPPSGTYSGFYKLPDAWLKESLAITEEENGILKFGASKRQIERQIIKEEHQSQREQRNREVARYLLENKETPYPEVAKIFGISESTVYRICKEYEIERRKKDDAKNKNETIQPARVGYVDRNEEPEKQTKKEPSLHFVAQSLLGVPSAGVEGVEVKPGKDLTGIYDGLVQAYYDLYGEVTESRRRRKQTVGQMGFRFGADGEVEYYMIS